jgi:hypothetical protein
MVGRIKKMMAGGPMKQGYSPRVSSGTTGVASRPAAAGVATRTAGAKKGGKIAGKMHGGKVHKKKK